MKIETLEELYKQRDTEQDKINLLNIEKNEVVQRRNEIDLKIKLIRFNVKDDQKIRYLNDNKECHGIVENSLEWVYGLKVRKFKKDGTLSKRCDWVNCHKDILERY